MLVVLVVVVAIKSNTAVRLRLQMRGGLNSALKAMFGGHSHTMQRVSRARPERRQQNKTKPLRSREDRERTGPEGDRPCTRRPENRRRCRLPTAA